MTQAELDREVAQVTGESVGEIRNRGFQLMVMPERRELTIDWDEVYPTEPIRKPRFRRRPMRLAA